MYNYKKSKGKKMKRNNKIGIFDSGIGGVTVLNEVIKILPQEEYIYYSDSKNNPYGDKSKEEVIKISRNIVEYFKKENCKVIVIACNTASAIAVETLRKEYPLIPFIAIEPAYKMVHDYAVEHTTLVMATKGTIESEKFNLLYHQYDNHKTYLLPCIGLADIIEEGNKEKIKNYLKEHIEIYKGKVKNIVLGCTHYPLIKKEIEELMGDVRFFDGSPRLAFHLKNILAQKDLLSNVKSGEINFIDSAQNKEKETRFYKYLEEYKREY